MTYMLSLSLNIPAVQLSEVGEILSQLAQHGDIEDISMRLIPGLAAEDQQQLQVGNGAPAQTGQVLPFTETSTKRRRKPASNETPAGAMPAAQPAVALNSGSDGVDASAFLAAAVTVGTSGGTTSLPADAHTSAVVVPLPNVPSIEEVRKFCADAVQADGTRRIKLTKLLAERGSSSISALAEEHRAEFFTRVKEEMQ